MKYCLRTEPLMGFSLYIWALFYTFVVLSSVSDLWASILEGSDIYEISQMPSYFKSSVYSLNTISSITSGSSCRILCLISCWPDKVSYIRTRTLIQTTSAGGEESTFGRVLINGPCGTPASGRDMLLTKDSAWKNP